MMMKRVVVFLVLILLTGCSNKESSSNSVLFGYVNISLPTIKGMTECSSHPAVQQVIRHFFQSGPVLGYYLDSETYKQIDKLQEISYDNYFMIYGDYQRENYQAVESDLEIMEHNIELSLFENENFEQISSKIEEDSGTVSAGKPALIEKYSLSNNVRTMIILMKYRDESSEQSVISAINFILVKNRLMNLAYYMTYDGGKSIDQLKEKNNEAVKKFLEINQL